MKLTKTGIGLLTRLYRSVLKKCFLINAGLWFIATSAILPNQAEAITANNLLTYMNSGSVSWIIDSEATEAKSVVFDEITKTATGTIGIYTGNEITYYTYTYTTPYDASERIPNAGGNVENKYFYNQAAGSETSVHGGGVNVSAYNVNIKADFIKNSANHGYGGALYSSPALNEVAGVYIGNHAAQAGGAMEIYGSTTNSIIGDFINNSAVSSAGALFTSSNTYKLISGNFIGNKTSSGGAIETGHTVYSPTNIKDLSGNFIGNYATGYGGAIYHADHFRTVTLTAKTQDTLFYGNQASSVESGHAVYNNGTLNLNANSGQSIIFDTGEDNGLNQSIAGSGTLTVNKTEVDDVDNQGTISFADVSGNSLDIGGGTVLFKGKTSLNDLTAGNATLDFRNKSADILSLNNLTINNDIIMSIDADLRALIADNFSAETYSITGNVILQNIDLSGLSSSNNVNIQLTDNAALMSAYAVANDVGGSASLFYDSISYDSNTGILTFSEKTGLNKIIGAWNDGNYILAYDANNDAKTSIGANLTALDSAIFTLSDSLSNNYYMKNNKKYKKLDIFIT